MKKKEFFSDEEIASLQKLEDMLAPIHNRLVYQGYKIDFDNGKITAPDFSGPTKRVCLFLMIREYLMHATGFEHEAITKLMFENLRIDNGELLFDFREEFKFFEKKFMKKKKK